MRLRIDLAFLFIGKKIVQINRKMSFDINNHIHANGLCVIVNINLSTTEFSIPETVVSLFITNAKLSKLPPLPKNLRVLDCGYNNLKTLPDLPDTLVVLSCSKNQLVTLPVLPKNLYKLSCHSNNLERLPSLPSNLRGLYCSSNALKQLPPLPQQLEVIICDDNNLTRLPDLPMSVKRIDFEENPLEEPYAKLYEKYMAGIITFNALRRSILEISLKNIQSFQNIFHIHPRQWTAEETSVVDPTKFTGNNLQRELQREAFGKQLEGSSLNSVIASYFTGKEKEARGHQIGNLQEAIQKTRRQNLIKNLAKKKQNYNRSTNTNKPNQFYQSLLKGGKTRKRKQKRSSRKDL
jgi:hypothetical protein